MPSNYDILIQKLDSFIRKYYKNLLIKGFLLSIGMTITFFVGMNLMEYFVWFGMVIRGILFSLFLLIIAGITGYFIVNPLMKIYRIGKIISHDQAASIIGKHFEEVKDKLLNTLQLKNIAEDNVNSRELIEASIDQKSEQLKTVHFSGAINLKLNRRYLKYALPPVIALLVILISAPKLLTEPGKRIMHFTTPFKKKQPYELIILNKNLQTEQQKDFVLNVGIEGEEMPDKVYVEYERSAFEMKKEKKLLFSYIFKNPQKNIYFRVKTDLFTSDEFIIKVLPKPIILNFDVLLDYPAYTGKKDELLQNTGDLVVPEGTNIAWKFFTKDTRSIHLSFSEKKYLLDNQQKNYFYYQRNFYQNEQYSLTTSNQYMVNTDSLIFSINVIKDAYPSIDVSTYEDSILSGRKYFSGNIRDDYGFSKLRFIVARNRKDSVESIIFSEDLKTDPGMNQQKYYYFYDFSGMNLNPGDEVTYYFEVFDNDIINGYKPARTVLGAFRLPTRDELKKEEQLSDNGLKEEMDGAVKELNKLMKQAEELQKKMVDKKNISWQEKKQLEDILNKQKEITDRISEIEKKFKENSLRQQEYNKDNEEIIQKQKELEKLFQEVLPDDLREQLMELQKLMNDLNKDKMNDILDKIKLNNEDIKKELDRNIELFKQLEFEKRISDVIEKLNEIQKSQKELSEQKAENKDDIQKSNLKQDSLNKEFEKFRQEMKKLKELNNKLENPNKLPDTKNKEEEITREMQNASEQMKENNQKKGKQSQKNAADKMDELGKQLEEAQQQMEEESYEEDEQSIRGILENLIKASFGQEDLMNTLNLTNYKDPRFNKIIQEQKKLRDDLQVIEDSLFALSKRQPLIKAIVNREINKINQKAEQVLDELKKMRKPQAVRDQQYIMQSINELALLLAESLQEMQNKQNSSSNSCSKKGGKCKKQGNSKPSMKTMKQLQGELNKKMDELRQQMQDGKQKGQMPKNLSEQLAKLAAQQQAIRKMMQEYADNLKEETGGTHNNLQKMLQDMQKTEEEIVNKNLNPGTVKRQQEILTRMLESEKAEKEREKEEKRESTEGKDINNSNQNKFLEYNRLKKKEDEILKTTPPSLNLYYKQKLEEYYLKIE